MNSYEQLNHQVFFSAMTPILKLGATRSLIESDLPELPKHLDPEMILFEESQISWDNGLSLMKSLVKATKKYWFRAFYFYMIFASMNLLGPVMVNLFVKQISKGFETREDLLLGITYGIAVGAVGLLGGLALQHYFLRFLGWFQIVINTLNKKIFSHALDLKKESREAVAIGDIVNHLSSDSDAVAEIGGALSDLIYVIVMMIGSISLLFYYLGPTTLVAIVLMGILIPITKKVSRDFTRYDEDLMRWRDKRVSLMSQILSAIRLVKYFAWEKSIESEVADVRKNELMSRQKIAKTELVVTMLYVSVSTLVLFAVLAVYTWRGGKLDSALVFTCVSLFALLEDPFAQISRVVSQLIAARVGADRITNFLKMQTVAQIIESDVASDVKAVGVVLNSITVRYQDSEVDQLQNISLRVPAGSSLAVVGGVGSGKSTFIHCLLREVAPTSGSFEFQDESGNKIVSPRLGYVPQEAFILNGTLRDNLTFGRSDVSDAEIWRALRLAQMERDVGLMAGGLFTEIGEKGINLSGGQRQRLSLARAILHQPHLVVLDDPLSAVDTNTENALIDELFFGEWRQKTRIMITHRLSHLEQFDQVAFLDQGRLIAVGDYKTLKCSSAQFQEYLREFEKSHTGPEIKLNDTLGQETKLTEASRVTDDEDRQFGAVKSDMYFDYIKSLAGESAAWRPVMIALLLIAGASSTLLPLLQKSWLAYVSNIQSGAASGGEWLIGAARDPLNAIWIYGGLGLIVVAGALFADMFWLKRGLSAGKIIHEKMLHSVLRTNVRFFDSTPVGRALQRFSRDMEAIDIHLQWSFVHSIKCFSQVIITLVLITALLPSVIVVLVPIFAIYYSIQKIYRYSAREVKRLDSISRSPRFAHFKETLQGLVVIRAFGKRQWFMSEFYKRLRHSQRMFYSHYMINRWFSARIPIIGGIVAMSTTFAIVIATRSGTISAGMAGLLTVYSLSFWGVLNWGIRVWAEVEARMTSMERVRFYMSLPPEVSAIETSSYGESWPEKGDIEFENVHVRYAPHMPLVLKGVQFKVRGGSRVGLVGRTGSGKSTIFQALYRFVDVEKGRILIDGVDIREISIERLRRSLAVIPQDPTLFMGTIRANLDRYNQFTDAEIYQVLEKARLSEFVRELPKGIMSELVENGVNLSQGQRQLLCLARALLLKAKIIVLDEATASVDVKTDAIVQRILRDGLPGVTMLIIAHRLGTVRDCDQIIEIADGTASNYNDLLSERHETSVRLQ